MRTTSLLAIVLWVLTATSVWAEDPRPGPALGCRHEQRPPGCTCERPIYPPDAARKGEQGRTVVQITVGVEGRVTDVETLESSGSRRLDRATLEYFKNVCFQPARDEQGNPVPAKAKAEYIWRLQ
jgi:TonB family protein